MQQPQKLSEFTEEMFYEGEPQKPPMSFEDAQSALEDVIDTLIEVGNGVTDEMLHEAANQLLDFRDRYFNAVVQPLVTSDK